MAKAIDLTGHRFGRLVVLKRAADKPTIYGHKPIWLCRCDCGRIKAIFGRHLRVGHTTSCGCWRAESSRERRVTHGMNGTPEYRCWVEMIRRCYNPQRRGFHNYGGRGIIVCDRWRNSFESFFADMGPRPSTRHSLDRMNNDGQYSPDNCRWATSRQQCRNTRANRLLAFGGTSRTLVEWSEHTAIPITTLHQRLAAKWTLERALTTPVRPKRR